MGIDRIGWHYSESDFIGFSLFFQNGPKPKTVEMRSNCKRFVRFWQEVRGALVWDREHDATAVFEVVLATAQRT